MVSPPTNQSNAHPWQQHFFCKVVLEARFASAETITGTNKERKADRRSHKTQQQPKKARGAEEEEEEEEEDDEEEEDVGEHQQVTMSRLLHSSIDRQRRWWHRRFIQPGVAGSLLLPASHPCPGAESVL